jgi:Protein of unknown function (DUF4242)
MQTFLIERHFGHVTPEQLQAGGSTSKRVAAEQFADTIVWERTRALQTTDGLVTFCVYQAPDEETVRAHAAAAGLPCDNVSPINVVGPADFA